MDHLGKVVKARQAQNINLSLRISVMILDELRIVIFPSTHSVFAKKKKSKLNNQKRKQTFPSEIPFSGLHENL